MKFVKGKTEGGMHCYTSGKIRIAVGIVAKNGKENIALMQSRDLSGMFYVVAQLQVEPTYVDAVRAGTETEWLEVAMSQLLVKLVDNNYRGVIMATELGSSAAKISIK
jgi:hypothetical protein